MKFRVILLFISLITACRPISHNEDFEVIAIVLSELEQRGMLYSDINRPYYPPPPESKEYYIKLRDDLSIEEASIRFDSIHARYQKHLLRISKRIIDSSKIYMATSNIIKGGTCRVHKIYDIMEDDLADNIKSKYKRYKRLISNCQKEDLIDIEIPFEQIEYHGKYRLKSIDEFPPKEEMFDEPLSFFKGGAIEFSRFYQHEDLGLISFSIYTCKIGCGSGHLALLEKKNGEWAVNDMLLRWID